MVVPKVCSHQRSGTHLLAASIKKNFNVGNVSGSIEVKDQEWYKTGSCDSSKMIWFDLIGSHKKYPNCKSTGSGFNDNQIVYVMRDPVDTLWSYFHFLNRSPKTPGMPGHDHPSKYDSFNNWISISSVEYWKKHVGSYMSNDFPIVRFENLSGDEDGFNREMKKIGNIFNLKSDMKKYERVQEKVGWSPGEGRSDYNKEMSEDSLSIFREAIGQSIFGYSI